MNDFSAVDLRPSVEQAGPFLPGNRPALEPSPMHKMCRPGTLAYAPLIHTRNIPRVCRECGGNFVTISRTQKECGKECARRRKTRYERKRNLRRRVSLRGTTVAPSVVSQGRVAKQ